MSDGVLHPRASLAALHVTCDKPELDRYVWCNTPRSDVNHMSKGATTVREDVGCIMCYYEMIKDLGLLDTPEVKA